MRKTQTEIPDDVKDVLAAGDFKPDQPLHYVLPPSLDRMMYVNCNEVLNRYGAKWKKGKIAAHVFESENKKSEFQVAVMSGIMVQKNGDSFYPTPRDVAELMCDEVAARTNFSVLNRHESFILEPSFGDGAIAKIIKEYWPMATLIGAEIDKDRFAIGNKYFDFAYHADFLTAPIHDEFDVVIMNPPFTAPNDPRACITHITKAWNLMDIGGVLVSVVPNSFNWATFRPLTELKTLWDTWDVI